MVIKSEDKNNLKVGANMENVVRMDDYKIKPDECEWEAITNIFQKAIKRKNLSKNQIDDITKNIIKDVRGNK